MNVSQVHSKINELQTCFRDQQYGDAEVIMQDFLDSFPDYQTPMLMYIRLMPSVDSENPLYLKILDLTRHYHQLTYFPGDLVPDWYEKISTRNIEIVLPVSAEPEPAMPPVSESSQVSEVGPVLTDESDIGESIDHLFPDQVPYEEEPEPPSTMFDPHSLADDEPIPATQPFVVNEIPHSDSEFTEPASSILTGMMDTEPKPETFSFEEMPTGDQNTETVISEVQKPDFYAGTEDFISEDSLSFDAASENDQNTEPEVITDEVPESELFAEPEPFSTEGFLSDDDNLPSSLMGSGFQQDGDEFTGFEEGGSVEYEPNHEQDDEILIASETMASIFAQQGKYDKAIKVYRMLMEEEPEMMDHFLQKVQELQKLNSDGNA